MTITLIAFTNIAIAFHGSPYRTQTGELTLKVTKIPELLAPSLHQRPELLSDPQTLARFPQLELECDDKHQILRLRHRLEEYMHRHFASNGFFHVRTPILAADAGGAVAKPFVTKSHKADHDLFLRIAPELELKKLVAAGMEKVYEIGPSFRNEGLDATHNPEFITCEFYEAYADLNELMATTEQLIRNLKSRLETAMKVKIKDGLAPLFFQSFRKISFLPFLERQLQKNGLPGFRFTAPITDESMRALLPELENHLKLDFAIGPRPKASQILDLLASRFIEPHCVKPTFITNYPSIMSPLAKSYICPDTGHELAARAEFFIMRTEYANMYEEENDPFAQARKFLQQRLDNSPARTSAEILDGRAITELTHDEVVEHLSPSQRYYVRVLEMGLPPTGGWGCGVDRLVMLFSGATRIGQTMPFGSLRNVIAMGT